MQVQFRCPYCSNVNDRHVQSGDTQVSCASCQEAMRGATSTWHDGRLSACLICPGTELFVRKDFPQRLGLWIVLGGFALSCLTWYNHRITATFVILLLTALADVFLYFLVPDVVECYNCHALYRGDKPSVEAEPFDLATHEKYRQWRLRRQARRSGSA